MENSKITIALDLEGTIISDETKRIPRPGLYPFLEGCRELARVVIYTMVDPDTAREITRELVARGHAPDWFGEVEWVDWYRVDTDFKDLDLIPGSDAAHAFLVDDHLAFVHPAQRRQWVRVEFFDPADPEDRELELALWKLQRKISGAAVPYPGDSLLAINEMQDEIEDLTLDLIELQAEKDRLEQIIMDDDKPVPSMFRKDATWKPGQLKSLTNTIKHQGPLDRFIPGDK